MALRVIRPGGGATVQDRGRPGFRSFGVPVGGAFDRGAFDLSNALLGNDPDDAALELTLVGGSYRAEVDLAIALAGAPMTVVLRTPSGLERRLQIPQSASLQAGDELILGGTPNGVRTYLAVRGGWQTATILGSRSTEERLKPGDTLPARSGWIPARRPVAPSLAYLEVLPIRVIDGPDASDGESRLLESGPYRVTTQADRMGLRLEGPPIAREARADRPSAPVAPGAIQITGGRPIVLGVAGGTMGGYFHLGHVIGVDLDRLGQLRTGDPVHFWRVELSEAREVDRLDRRDRATRLASIAEICRSDLRRLD